MGRLSFVKVEGTGNDYVLVDAFDPQAADDVGRDPAGLARALSDRHRGVGSDGLLVVGPPDGAATARLRMYNADGSEGRMCGNGLRCVVRYLVETGRAERGSRVEVETAAGLRHGRMVGPARVELEMGVPDFRPQAVPVHGARVGADGAPPAVPVPPELHADPSCGYCVSVGNPHVVVRVARPEDVDLPRHGPALSLAPELPLGANAHFVAPEDAGRLRARTWEIGSGATQACGTGAVAVAAVARALGWSTADAVTVVMPGGELVVAWDRDGGARLVGPARFAFRGECRVP